VIRGAQVVRQFEFSPASLVNDVGAGFTPARCDNDFGVDLPLSRHASAKAGAYKVAFQIQTDALPNF
jgi:hypothetical protein